MEGNNLSTAMFPSLSALGNMTKQWKEIMFPQQCFLVYTGLISIKFYFLACSCGPMGCICHPLSLKSAKGKRRNKGTHGDSVGKKMDKKEQTASKRATICKCGAMGCGCAPIPGEETGAKREDAPATSPHPIDLAVGWPFGYGPSFGWGPVAG